MKGVWHWYYNFSQVGGLSQAREDDSRAFKFFWLLAYGLGIVFTIASLAELYRDYAKYEVHHVSFLNLSGSTIAYLPSTLEAKFEIL